MVPGRIVFAPCSLISSCCFKTSFASFIFLVCLCSAYVKWLVM